MLGDELFSECLKVYMQRWAGKHPTPYDFMFTFNHVCKQDLNWFWQAWIFDYGYADLAIKEIGESKVWIENMGRLPVPVFLKLVYKNGQEKIIHKTADIWAKGDRMVSIELDDFKNLESVELLSDKFPDVDSSNNFLKIENGD
jgi:aminopeptidase N